MIALLVFCAGFVVCTWIEKWFKAPSSTEKRKLREIENQKNRVIAHKRIITLEEGLNLSHAYCDLDWCPRNTEATLYIR